MVRLWHSPQKLCFYNSSNNNSNNNSIDRTKKFWQNTEYKKNSIQLNRLMPSTDSITSPISINQLTNTSTSASAQLITVPHAVQINSISISISTQQVCIAACDLSNSTSNSKKLLTAYQLPDSNPYTDICSAAVHPSIEPNSP